MKGEPKPYNSHWTMELSKKPQILLIFFLVTLIITLLATVVRYNTHANCDYLIV